MEMVERKHQVNMRGYSVSGLAWSIPQCSCIVRLALILCAGNHDRPLQAFNNNGGSQDSKRESQGEWGVYFTSSGLVGMCQYTPHLQGVGRRYH